MSILICVDFFFRETEVSEAFITIHSWLSMSSIIEKLAQLYLVFEFNERVLCVTFCLSCNIYQWAHCIRKIDELMKYFNVLDIRKCLLQTLSCLFIIVCFMPCSAKKQISSLRLSMKFNVKINYALSLVIQDIYTDILLNIWARSFI